jgi:hypothetical protein
MQYVNLLGAQEHCGGLRPFAKMLFDALGVKDSVERESSNYIDGYYLKGSLDGLNFTVSLTDDDAHEDLPYWVQVAADMSEPDLLIASVEQIVSQLALLAGFRFARIVNYGKCGEQRVDY